jgi:hypothetical protein
VVQCEVSPATGTVEVRTAISMIDRLVEDASFPIKTVGADKGYHRKNLLESWANEG